MKKLITLVLCVMMLVAMLAGCGGQAAPAKTDDIAQDNGSVQQTDIAEDNTVVSQEPASQDPATSTGSPVADAYAAYLEAKNVVVTKLSDGISNNPDTAFSAMSFMGVSMLDLALLPVSLFGLGQQGVEAGLGIMGATGVQYSENGNSYTVSFKNDDGSTSEMTGTYDAAADALICTGKTDGTETIYSEYHKTAFGYVGQYYFVNEDGTTSLYQIAVDGENGTIGMANSASKPAALTGSESADFPTACSEWYAINGTTITGLTSDGTQLNFEYTPSAE